MADEKYAIEEALENLNIDYDDIAQVSDGSSGYLFLLVSNIDEEGREKLISLEFHKVFDDLWCREGEDLSEIPKSKLIEIIERKCGKESAERRNEFEKDISELWQSLVNNYCNILETYDGLKPTVRDIKEACKQKGLVCKDEDSLKLFLISIKELLRGFFKVKDIKSFLVSLESNNSLRHYYIHDLEKGDKEDLEVTDIHEIFKEIINKPIPSGPRDFWLVQQKILEDCNDVLKKLLI